MHGVIGRTADLGLAVRSVRLATGMTQDELSAKLGVSQRWLWELETGKPKVLNDRFFVVLASLGIELTWQGPQLTASDDAHDA
ncbi:Helix-turn-helix domain-containing protein [Micrococcales bacterium KH10]|nr:Helix-turn-helix domain-containing protein [Micrococcales bacterium KH10]